MEYLGVRYEAKHLPELDPQFVPFGVWMNAYRVGAEMPLAIAVERDQGPHFCAPHEDPRNTPNGTGGLPLCRAVCEVSFVVCGWLPDLHLRLQPVGTAAEIGLYPHGRAKFDAQFMQDVYEVPMEVVDLPLEQCPKANETARPIGGHLEGCRIGFDAGGSDRKVSAVVDGQTVYSEEVVWHPKTQEDPQYHFDGIVEAFRTAASKMPRVDAIGVSSAGVFIGNAPMVSSLFIKVPGKSESW